MGKRTSTKLTPVGRRFLIRRMRNLGFSGLYRKKKHSYMERDGLMVTIPNPQRQDISVDLLKKILSQADISRDEWLGR